MRLFSRKKKEGGKTGGSISNGNRDSLELNENEFLQSLPAKANKRYSMAYSSFSPPGVTSSVYNSMNPDYSPSMNGDHKLNDSDRGKAVDTPEFFVNTIKLLPNIEILASLCSTLQSKPAQWSKSYIDCGGIEALLDVLVHIEKQTNHGGIQNNGDVILQSLTVTCLLSLFNTKYGIDRALAAENSMSKLILSMDCQKVDTRCSVFEILTAVCIISSKGYQLVLEAMTHFKQQRKERFRFTYLVESMRKMKDDKEYLTTCLSLINGLVNSSEEIDERVQLRTEFSRLELDDLIKDNKNLPYDEYPDLLTQIDVYEDEARTDQEELSEQFAGLDFNINDPKEVFEAIHKQVQQRPLHHPFLHILQCLLSVPSDSDTSMLTWFLIEKLIQQVTLNKPLIGEEGEKIGLDDLLASVAPSVALQSEYQQVLEELSKTKDQLKKVSFDLNVATQELASRQQETSVLKSNMFATVKMKDQEIQNLKKQTIRRLDSNFFTPPPGMPSFEPPTKDETTSTSNTNNSNNSSSNSSTTSTSNSSNATSSKPPKPGKTKPPKSSDSKPPKSSDSKPPKSILKKEPSATKVTTSPTNLTPSTSSNEVNSIVDSNNNSTSETTSPPIIGGPPPPPPPPMNGGGPPPPPPPPMNGGGPPPPPPPMGKGGILSSLTGGNKLPSNAPKFQISKPVIKVKQLQWTKIPNRKLGETIFCNLGNIKTDWLNIQEIENLFSTPETKDLKSLGGAGDKKSSLAASGVILKPGSVSVIDPKKSQNLAIYLSKFKCSLNDIKNAIYTLDEELFTLESLKGLEQHLPTEEDMEAIRDFLKQNSDTKLLAKPEQFLLEIETVTYLHERVKAFILKSSFPDKLKEIKPDLDLFCKALDQIQTSKHFLKVIEVILIIGNFLNGGTSRGDCYGFKLDGLLKLTDTKTFNNKSNLLVYVISEIEQKFPESLQFIQDLSLVAEASKISLSTIMGELNTLKKDLDAVISGLEKMKRTKDETYFFHTIDGFIKDAKIELKIAQEQYGEAEKQFEKITMLFGEEPKTPSEEFFSFINRFILTFDKSWKDFQREKEAAERAMKRDELKAKKIQAVKKMSSSSTSLNGKSSQGKGSSAVVLDAMVDDIMQSVRDGDAFKQRRQKKVVPSSSIPSSSSIDDIVGSSTSSLSGSSSSISPPSSTTTTTTTTSTSKSTSSKLKSALKSKKPTEETTKPTTPSENGGPNPNINVNVAAKALTVVMRARQKYSRADTINFNSPDQ
ncbi:actin binding protein [Tieghemostelium lacteum]|uniref:Actin binding protein n=1 Tax=Tieghemostelium lacteum TaxID=361077 RepID=A0A151ZDM7_TIELA|nr:actin binding protein [Tieghemostelium lacteum]|eukprot:KYQ92010.1 actin binding protein [Tieghemostelium lacteum]